MTEPEVETPAAKPPMQRRGLRLALAALAVFLLVPALAVLGLDTGPGHVVFVALVDRVQLSSGLGFRLARIDGSIWSRMRLEGLALRDPAGDFIEARSVFVDWRPAALLRGTVVLEHVTAPDVRLLRAPRLKVRPPKPNQPVLPDIHLKLRDLRIGALTLEPPLTGERRSLSLAGAAEVLRPRLLARLSARAGAVDGRAGGDALDLDVDAEPDANRLALTARLVAPAGGVVDRLLKLGAPLDFDLGGRGGWRAWDGKAAALLGGKPLLEATLGARNGLFTARGQAFPALLVNGPLADIARPPVAFSIAATESNRRLALDATLVSAALSARARGGVDMARSRFADLRIGARVNSAASLLKDLAGRDVGIGLVLTGPFAEPAFAVDLEAQALSVGGVSLQGLRGSAQGLPHGGRLALAARASAARIAGLPYGLDVLGEKVGAGARITLTRGRITGDVKVISSRLAATFALASSPLGGPWNGRLTGRAMQLPIAGAGVFDIDADASMSRIGGRDVGGAGHVRARSLALTSPAARELLGGQATAAGDFMLSKDGALALNGVTLAAPKFRLTQAQARLGPGDALAISADAVSEAYGPLKLAVSGTRAAPLAHLQAVNPKVAGITGLDARLAGLGSGRWRVTAAARSPYGPLALDSDLVLAGDLAAADIRRASLRGVILSGSVRQTPAGPLTGQLRVAGDGLAGGATLSAIQGDQSIDLTLTATRARLPIDPPLIVSSGEARATLRLRGKGLAVTGRASARGVRWNGITLADARLDGRWDSAGSGAANLAIKGQGATPFTLSGQAALSPGLVRVTGGGSAGGVPIRLAAPAEARRSAGVWRLAATPIALPRGRLVLAGSWGAAGLSGSVRLDSADLAIGDAFSPGLGLAGQANGSLSFGFARGGGMPTGAAQLQLSGLSRASLAGQSEPVDVALVASLTGSQGLAHAIVRRRGEVVGRLQATLGPLPKVAASWSALASAPLSGGVRWNGPAEALWSLTALPGQTLSGPLAIGADVSGVLDRPQITGVVKGQSLRYANAAVGTTIDQIDADGRFTGTHLQIDKLAGRAGSGTIAASGYVDLSSAEGYPIDLRLVLSHARLARNDQASVTASGELAATNSRAAGALVAGKLTLDDASYELARTGGADVIELTGVRRKDEPAGSPVTPSDAAAPTPGPPSRWKLNITLDSSNHLIVRGMGLSAEWAAALTIRGDVRHPVVVGDITAVRGSFDFAGRELTLTRGLIHLDGADPPDPTLDIVASTSVEGVTANVAIAGTSSHPRITFSSAPALPQEEVLSRLLFGTSAANISPAQAVQLAASINTLRGGGSGPLGRLQKLAGLDRLSFYAADKTTGRAAGVGAGKYVTRNIYLEITTDARGYTATQIQIALRRSLELLSQLSAVGSSNLSLRFTHTY